MQSRFCQQTSQFRERAAHDWENNDMQSLCLENMTFLHWWQFEDHLQMSHFLCTRSVIFSAWSSHCSCIGLRQPWPGHFFCALVLVISTAAAGGRMWQGFKETLCAMNCKTLHLIFFLFALVDCSRMLLCWCQHSIVVPSTVFVAVCWSFQKFMSLLCPMCHCQHILHSNSGIQTWQCPIICTMHQQNLQLVEVFRRCFDGWTRVRTARPLRLTFFNLHSAKIKMLLGLPCGTAC